MSYETLQTLLLLLLALIIGAFLGCMCRRWFAPSKQDKDDATGMNASMAVEETSQSQSDRSSAAVSPVVDTAGAPSADQGDAQPAALAGARDGRPDDLQRINGIGKKLELKLNDLGVYHYDQIADWDRENVAWVGDHLSFKGRIDREEWIPQAKQLAAGETTAFSKAYDRKHKGKPAVKKSNKSGPSAKSTKSAKAAKPAKSGTAVKSAPSPSVKEPVQSRGLAAPIGGKADDLKTISGVGPKLEKTLNDLGIFHFEQVASWTASDVAEVDDLLSFKGRIEREGWIAQAKKLSQE